MFRRIYRVLVFFSALCLLCGAVLWPVSYRRGSGVSCSTGKRLFHAEFLDGQALFVSLPTSRTADFRLFKYIADPTIADWSYNSWHFERKTVCAGVQVGFAGMGVSGNALSNPRELRLSVPLSYLTLLSTILPAIALRGHFRRRRKLSHAFPVDPAPQPN
ncbi:MAG TPA: hypothetical protein VHM90_00945 [Phycisphaerae bacterium]|nr:hypothetical protein [Phycisphaerae bacterium]